MFNKSQSKSGYINTRQRIAIIGGGVAGLAFAVYYKRLGGRVDIYESSAKSGHEGLGFILLKNGLKAMESLGLGQQVIDVGFLIKHCSIVDDTGRSLMEQGLQNCFGITRKAFIDLLLNEIPTNWLHFNYEFSHFKWHENPALAAKAAVFKNGEQVEADLFIGSDGAGSSMRKQIFPEARRSNVKCKELVSMINNPALVQQLNQTFIKYKSLKGGLAVGIVPASQDTVLWFVQFSVDCYNKNLLIQADYKTFVRKLVGNWPQPIQNLIETTNFSCSYLRMSAYLIPLHRFYKNNVVLIGDAAHALSPFTSQGVSSAIEDAIELTKTIENKKFGCYELAFENYSVIRQATVNQYVDQGIVLQEEFLSPHQPEQKLPFAF